MVLRSSYYLLLPILLVLAECACLQQIGDDVAVREYGTLRGTRGAAAVPGSW